MSETSIPLSHRLPLLIAEAERRGMKAPLTVSVVCVNKSVCSVCYDGGSPFSFNLLAGSVQPTGYALPALVLVVDVGAVALLARLNGNGAFDLLHTPGNAGRPL